jgi:elongation factor G
MAAATDSSKSNSRSRSIQKGKGKHKGTVKTESEGDVSAKWQPILAFTVSGISKDGIRSVESAMEKIRVENPGANLTLAPVEGGVAVGGDEESLLEEIRDQVTALDGSEVGEIGVCYRETIRTAAEAHGKYIRQTGGCGNYGHCVIRLEPGRPGSGVAFTNRLEASQIPEKYIGAIERGVKESLAGGVRAGRAITDVKAALIDGSWHETDSNEDAFRSAGAIAAEEAGKKAHPLLLEPMMEVELLVAKEDLPAVSEEVYARRGRIISNDEVLLAREVVALVPLAEVLNASARGKPDWEMRFSGYEMVVGRDDTDGKIGMAMPKWPRDPGPRRDRASKLP